MWRHTARAQVFEMRAPSALLLRNYRARTISSQQPTQIAETSYSSSPVATLISCPDTKFHSKLHSEFDDELNNVPTQIVHNTETIEECRGKCRPSRFSTYDIYRDLQSLSLLCEKPELSETEKHEIIFILDRLKPIMMLSKPQNPDRDKISLQVL